MQDEGATHTPTPTATGVPTNAKHSNPISTNSLRNTGANKYVLLLIIQYMSLPNATLQVI